MIVQVPTDSISGTLASWLHPHAMLHIVQWRIIIDNRLHSSTLVESHCQAFFPFSITYSTQTQKVEVGRPGKAGLLLQTSISPCSWTPWISWNHNFRDLVVESSSSCSRAFSLQLSPNSMTISWDSGGSVLLCTSMKSPILVRIRNSRSSPKYSSTDLIVWSSPNL